MKEISLAILAVGLCFYNLELYKIGGKAEIDWVASLISLIAAVRLLTIAWR